MVGKIAELISLASLKTGEQATLLEMNAGVGCTSRLTSLGFTPGVEVVMTQNFGRGPLMVTVRGTRVALGRHEARRIIVQRREA